MFRDATGRRVCVLILMIRVHRTYRLTAETKCTVHFLQTNAAAGMQFNQHDIFFFSFFFSFLNAHSFYYMYMSVCDA